jgi:predicted outer membrane protein
VAKLADLASRKPEEFDPAYLETEEEKKKKTPTRGACC